MTMPPEPKDPFKKDAKKDPLSHSIAGWRPRGIDAGKEPTGQEAAAGQPVAVEQPLERVRRAYRAAHDAYRERLDDIRQRHTVVIPEYKGFCPAVPLEVYAESKDPAAIEYVPIVADPNKQRDHFYFAVVQRHEPGYKQTSEDNRVLWHGINLNQNRLARNGALEAQRAGRITERHSVLMSCRLDQMAASQGGIFLGYTLHPKLRERDFDGKLIAHLLQLFHDDFGYRALIVGLDDIPVVGTLAAQLPAGVRVLDMSQADPTKYKDDAEVMRRYGVTLQDALVHYADASLF